MTFSTSLWRGRAATLVAAVALIGAVAFGLVQRWQFVGSLYDLGHQGLTATTAIGVDNWERDGFWNDSGSLVEIPASIEFEGIQDRSLYVSYPPGAQIEIFLLRKSFPGVDTTTLAQLFGLANQIAIALLSYLIVMALPFVGPRRLFATISASLYLLHPIPYYWHATVFFADQAVILPFAVAIYLEARIRTQPAKWHLWAQAVILGMMAYIDWLIIPFAITLFAFRLISPIEGGFAGRTKQAIAIFLLPAVAIATHLAVVLYLHRTFALLERFVFRTGVSNSGAAYVKNFFQQFFVEYLGLATTVLIVMTAVFFGARLVFNRRDQVAAIALVGIGSCVLQVFLLRNHSVNHSFAALKFIFPLCYATFGLMPLSILDLLRRRAGASVRGSRAGPGKSSATLGLAGGLMGLFALGYLMAERTGWQDLFPPRVLTNGEIARWLGAHAGYDDVFVSNEVDIQKYPPQVMVISRKYVWKFETAPDLTRFVNGLPAGAVVHLIQRVGKLGCPENAIGDTIAVVGDYSVIRVAAPLATVAQCVYPDAGSG